MIKMEYNNTTQAGDLSQTSGKIDQDDGLETAVLISLFTDARADEGDDGAEEGDRRGCWQDTYPDVDGDSSIGSKLWLLFRGKLTKDTLRKSVQYAEESLAWMIEDGVAVAVSASATWLQDGSYKVGALLNVQIQKPGDVAPTWQRTWELYADGL